MTQLAESPGFTLQGAFHNSSIFPVRLHEIGLLEIPRDNFRVRGEPDSWLLSNLINQRRSGHLGEVLLSQNEITRRMWAGFKKPCPALKKGDRFENGRWRSFRDSITLYSDVAQTGIVMGAVGPAEAYVRFDVYVGDDGLLSISIVSEMDDVLVEPGETRISEEVLVLPGPRRASVLQVLQWIRATHGHRIHRGPVTGWCSWYDKGRNITAEEIQATTEAFQTNSETLKIDVIQVDDGFQKQVGDWRCNERFPDGWNPVVNKIKALQAMPGIWIAPLAVHESLGWHEKNPDWFQYKADGQLLDPAAN